MCGSEIKIMIKNEIKFKLGSDKTKYEIIKLMRSRKERKKIRGLAMIK